MIDDAIVQRAADALYEALPGVLRQPFNANATHTCGLVRAVLSAVLVEVDCPTCHKSGEIVALFETLDGIGGRIVPCPARGCAGTGRLLVVERRRTHECDG